MASSASVRDLRSGEIAGRRSRQFRQQLRCAIGIVLANPELGRTAGGRTEQILQILAADEVLDVVAFEQRLRKGDERRIAGREDADEIDVRRRLRTGQLVDGIDVACRTDHHVPRVLFAALGTEHWRWPAVYRRV